MFFCPFLDFFHFFFFNQEEKEIETKRSRIRQQLDLGELEDRMVTIEVEESQSSMFDMMQGSGMEQMGMNMQDAFSQFMPKKNQKKKAPRF